MGAWGSGPFENDDAMDFVGALAGAPASETLPRLARALSLPEGYVESPDGSTAVAASALVAARRGYEITDPTASALLADRPFEPDAALRASAVTALGRVAAEDSELMELWDEAGGRDAVEAVYRDIRSFL